MRRGTEKVGPQKSIRIQELCGKGHVSGKRVMVAERNAWIGKNEVRKVDIAESMR